MELADLCVLSPKPRHCCNHQKLEEARKLPFQSSWWEHELQFRAPNFSFQHFEGVNSFSEATGLCSFPVAVLES